MKVTFIIPPVLQGRRPAERTAGCTHMVYPIPNIYELTVAAEVEATAFCTVEYHDFVHQRTTARQFERWLAGDNADVYLIWVVNLSIENDLAAVRLIHTHRPTATVLLLGPGPTHFTDQCLPREQGRTIVVRGEPDATVVELLDVLNRDGDLHSVRGIAFRDTDSEVYISAPRPLLTDLDALPLPARHLIAQRRFYNPKLKVDRYTTAFTSRNCPYRCSYCVPSSLSFAREIEHRRITGHKPPVAMRSVASVEREMRQIAELGYRGVGFMDDNFIWNETRTRQICDIMTRCGLVWGCQARVDAITPTIADLLARGGCRYVDLGVESFDNRILDDIGKGITAEQTEQAIRTLQHAAVPVKINVLIGCSPLETPETVRQTLQRVKQLDVDQVMFNIVSPFPGTAYYERCKQNGWLEGGEYRPTDVQRHSIVNLPHLSARQMERALRRNNLRYFLSWRFATKQLRQFTSMRQLVHAARALTVKLFG